MNLRGYSDEIIDSFTSGAYVTDPVKEFLPGQQAKFNQSFSFVDGNQYPLSLVHPDIPQEGNQLGMIGVESVHGDSSHPEPWAVQEYLRDTMRRNIGGMCMTGRRLFGQNTTYMVSLGMVEEDFRAFIRELSAEFNHRSLAVLDAGCGDGLAFHDLLGIDEVDQKNSVGLTLPHRHTIDAPDPELLYANIMHCGEKKRFDLSVSCQGAFTYHPTNHYRQRSIQMLAFLNLINLTKEGGVILGDHFYPPARDELLKGGILGRMEKTFPLRVLRHPTVDEVMKYTRPKAA